MCGRRTTSFHDCWRSDDMQGVAASSSSVVGNEATCRLSVGSSDQDRTARRCCAVVSGSPSRARAVASSVS